MLVTPESSIRQKSSSPRALSLSAGRHCKTVSSGIYRVASCLYVKKKYVIGVMQKHSKLSDREILSKSHDYFANNTLLPLTDPAAIRYGLPPDKADVKLQQFYDNSLLEELAKESRVDR